ncbi:hypothetical protein [Iodobacter sp.]|uniref:hypothetical protein n=1 Tax=Iodobacter sp. TaxID=1915058 RepID=UPI0025E60FC7|nr:hypothetical protein [Iodobacter sp.]
MRNNPMVQVVLAQIGYLLAAFYNIDLQRYTHNKTTGAEFDQLIRQKLGGLGYEF